MFFFAENFICSFKLKFGGFWRQSNFEKELLEKFDLIDIWSIGNTFSKRYTFRKIIFSGYIQGRLDYIFVSNTLKESLQQTTILPSFCSHRCPILVSYNKTTKIYLEKTFGRFTVL